MTPSRFDRSVWIGAPIGVVAAFLFFGIGMVGPPNQEIAVRVPTAVRSDDATFPIRVVLVHHGGATVEPIALESGFEVRVIDAAGDRAEVPLRGGAFGHAEGAVLFNGGLPLRIGVVAQLAGEEVSVSTEVVDLGEGGFSPLEPRDIHLTSATSNRLDEPELLVRVEGGLCVPQVPCDLLIWVRGPGAGSRIELADGARSMGGEELITSAGLSSITRHHVTLNQARGAVRLMHGDGPEAREIARAPIPVALSSGYLRIGADHGLDLGLELPPEQTIAEVFHDGRWVETVSGPGARLRVDAPWGEAGLRQGVWRVQVRGEELREGAAGVRVLWGGADSLGETLRALGWPLHGDSARVLDDEGLWERQPERASAFVLAGFETVFRRLPRRVYGGPQRLAELEARRVEGRWLGTLVILLLGVMVTAFVLGRSRWAVGEASAVIRAAERATGSAGRRPGSSDVLRIIGGAALVLLAFLFLAALMYSKDYF